jgi:heme exporter protein C
MVSFGVLTVASLGYIVTKKESWDWVARAAAELGAIFITLGTILGAIWGKATWGTWWTWDPKLTATFILWFIYIGYILLRSYMGRTSASAYAGAVLSIVGVIDVPIIYLSVLWWRGQHPTAEVGVAQALPASVTLTLMVALLAFTLLYVFLMTQLYQLQRLQTLASRLRVSIE